MNSFLKKAIETELFKEGAFKAHFHNSEDKKFTYCSIFYVFEGSVFACEAEIHIPSLDQKAINAIDIVLRRLKEHKSFIYSNFFNEAENNARKEQTKPRYLTWLLKVVYSINTTNQLIKHLDNFNQIDIDFYNKYLLFVEDNLIDKYYKNGFLPIDIYNDLVFKICIKDKTVDLKHFFTIMEKIN